MKLEGIHHITAITADAQGNVDFYAGVLGLRLVKKSVNQDDPSVYHLFYADESASPGSDLTFFEYPGAAPGRPGAGMVHTIVWRIGSADALGFWSERLAAAGLGADRVDGRLRFADREGLAHELAVVETGDDPLVADHPQITRELALQGFDGVRAYSGSPDASRALLEGTLGFAPWQEGSTPEDGSERQRGLHRVGWEMSGDQRSSFYAYDEPPVDRGHQGAGSVHHVAWASQIDDQTAWRDVVALAGAHPTPVIDRFYFRSIYFREPSGVLFEIATIGPGFSVDEDPEHLGEKLSLPPVLEHLREQIEPRLTPLENPRAKETPG